MSACVSVIIHKIPYKITHDNHDALTHIRSELKSTVSVGRASCTAIALSVMPTLRGILGSLVGIVFEYDTPKFVHIRNKKIGILNRLIQLGIILFVIV